MSPRLRDDRGASAVELSIVAPGLLLLVFFSVQAALWFYGRTVAEQAAREGVSRLRLAQTEAVSQDLEDDVQRAVEGYARAVGREALLSPQATTDYDAQTGRVEVGVTGQVITLVPGVRLRVTQRAFGEVERFEEDLRR